MAANDFTNIRVESKWSDYTTLRWDYAGSNDITIWRSTDDVSYSQIALFSAGYNGYDTEPSPFTDTSVNAETLYYYKLSDDGGSTKTSAVSVTTQKAFSEEQSVRQPVSLPTIALEEDVNAANLQQMVDELQHHINNNMMARPQDCLVCPTNGAVVLDCTNGCYSFRVQASDIADINSITVNCPGGAEVVFEVPEGTETEICGWPDTSRFTGDECFEAPVSGAISMPTTVIVPPPKPVGCQHTRTRVPTISCRDYIKDCYDTGSLFATTPLTGTWDACVGRSDGCCSGNTDRNISGLTITVRSGKADILTQEHTPLAGYSLWFTNSLQDAAGGAPWETEIYVPLHKRAGKPIAGVAFNVVEGSTVTSFTGRVLLVNWQAGKVQLVFYNAQSLRDGTPTVLNESSISLPNSVEFLVSNFPSGVGGEGLFEVYNWDTAATIYSLTNAGYTAPVGTCNLGVGVVWMGNSVFGTHAAQYDAGASHYIQCWRSNGGSC